MFVHTYVHGEVYVLNVLNIVRWKMIAFYKYALKFIYKNSCNMYIKECKLLILILILSNYKCCIS